MKYRFKEVYPYEKGFADYFEQELMPLLKQVERHRKAALNKFVILLISCILITILLTVFGFSEYGDEDCFGMFYFLWIIASFIMLGWVYSSFKDKAKTKVNEKLVKFFGNFNYKLEEGIPYSVLDEVDFIFPSYDIARYDDYIQGIYNDNKIEFCEGRLLEEYTDSDGDDQERKVFKGLFILLTLPKTFMAKTYVVKNKNVLFKLFQKSITDYLRVEVNNTEFERRYDIYSSSPVEAKSILTYDLQRKIMKLAKNFGSSTLNCCFFDNKVFISIPVRKNLFESVSLFKSAFNEYQFKTFLRDFDLVLSISDTITDHFARTEKTKHY